jgi:hypothetical protein
LPFGGYLAPVIQKAVADCIGEAAWAAPEPTQTRSARPAKVKEFR